MANLAFCLMGPTASGKTALAGELIKQFPFEIISVDSAMIYREMNIGTAKPTWAELQQMPHHLIDIIDPPASYSAAEFCVDALRLIELVYHRGHIPLLVGGTMMYFNALQQGLAYLPAANQAIRQQLSAEAKLQGWAYLHARLKQVDAISAAKIHPNDSQRIQRALEVYYLTGEPQSAFWQRQNPISAVQFINLILFPKRRAWLHNRIAERFQSMLQQGLVAEVEQLIIKWQLATTCTALRTVGYRQVSDFIAGYYNYPTLVDKGIAATRQLAKRQLTWLRNWKDAYFLDCESPSCMDEIMAIIAEILDNHC